MFNCQIVFSIFRHYHLASMSTNRNWNIILGECQQNLLLCIKAGYSTELFSMSTILFLQIYKLFFSKNFDLMDLKICAKFILNYFCITLFRGQLLSSTVTDTTICLFIWMSDCTNKNNITNDVFFPLR